MSISADKIETIERLVTHLLSLTELELAGLFKDDGILKDTFFATAEPVEENRFACFYSPFDWVNDSADIILIGITPGKRQAIDSLLTLRSALESGKPVVDAAARAKQVASFNGEMRDVASELMDYFCLNDVFGVEKSAILFDEMAHRTHYTSCCATPFLSERP